MQGDKAALTRSILDAALVELADVGQADFAVERVVKNAYCSVGSVYERWRDRGELLAEVAPPRRETLPRVPGSRPAPSTVATRASLA